MGASASDASANGYGDCRRTHNLRNSTVCCTHHLRNSTIWCPDDADNGRAYDGPNHYDGCTNHYDGSSNHWFHRYAIRQRINGRPYHHHAQHRDLRLQCSPEGLSLCFHASILRLSVDVDVGAKVPT